MMAHRFRSMALQALHSIHTCCSSRALLCLASSFVGATFAFCYLLPAYWDYHQFSSHLSQVADVSGTVTTCPCQTDRKIIILYWTKYFRSTDFGFGMGLTPFHECHTNQTSNRRGCLTTTDRSFVNDSDAILFHARDININDLPPAGWRRPHQNYVFLLYESPVNTNLNMLRQPLFRNYFNRTMTYRRDSDVVDLHPYGHMQCIDAASPSCSKLPQTADAKKPNIVQENDDSTSVPVKIDLTLKNWTVAWFVSNCETNSRRELLARNLSHFIPVDIFGHCANANNITCSDRAACDEKLSRHYRFYLSFENSLCLDYVTEKLYRPLQHNAVPVVYGGADYSLYLPAGSYVNAMDFGSPERLADHLNKLMGDDELYLTYFRWKSKYAVERRAKDAMCQLCQLLGDSKTKEKSYADIAEWWAEQSAQRVCNLRKCPTFLFRSTVGPPARLPSP
ncbi:alpha-(1,3)-fucosyltransferase C-like isoform X1 [Daphnia magna]|uniref:alpha-(1,3)-fucosyltransferase C-like isoform X1 n=1 Tax=Daphnia magna TaxID=35525 RepID=UPI001E1BB629|nr:alpha-(1,3)-fucosyltransferase C-like isoform X1 [Daphnia magna]XP_045032421.1 alpha-(1,3)-fucosyltransferase C-like isoform X1 [Daphnia magna]